MSKRHNDALAIWGGACNPSGIAISIVEACREARDEVGFTGTAKLTSDPAIKLMVYQLAYICGIINGADDMAKLPSTGDCILGCRIGADNKETTR